MINAENSETAVRTRRTRKVETNMVKAKVKTGITLLILIVIVQ